MGKSILISIFFILLPWCLLSQYPPGAGSYGTTAIHADSGLISSWATSVRIQRGYMNIDEKEMGYASAGVPENALGKADNFVVSLGDSGIAVLGFDQPVINHGGYDFAVFENSFDGSFLELAFVEVSSDSIKWVRFASSSETPSVEQVDTYGTIDPSHVNNLAGKYSMLYGTPFDLDELKDSSGVDINNVRFIRIIDVIGSVTEGLGTCDSKGNPINDPWPTPFPSSGFDLDGVAILGEVSGVFEGSSLIGSIYPVPAASKIYINCVDGDQSIFTVSDFYGRRLITGEITGDVFELDITTLIPGTYFFEIISGTGHDVKLFIKK